MIEPRKLLYAILVIAALIAGLRAVTSLQADHDDDVAFSETIDKCLAVMAQVADGDAIRQAKADCRPLLRNQMRQD